MVIYKEKDDFGSIPNNKYSYYYGSNIEAIACCNITPFIVQTPVYPGPGDVVPLGRTLEDEDVEVLTTEEYKEIFGVEYDPADWAPEAFTE